RWQSRYLEPEDYRTMMKQLADGQDVLCDLLAQDRPELDHDDRIVLSASVLSAIGSISDHHVSIPVRALTGLLRVSAYTVLDCVLPPAGAGGRTAPATEIPLTFKHELLLKKSVELFHQRGYPNVSVEDIANAAGLPASSAVYRFYRSKGDILAAAFRRAADRVSAAIGPAIAATDGPREALTRLIELYVEGSFAEREL